MTNEAIEETTKAAQTTTATQDIVTVSSTDIMSAMSSEMSTMLSQAAEEQAADEASSVPFLSIKGKRFSMNETKIGTSMDVVVLATMYDNAYYDRPYNADVITPPACFALNINEADMVPDPSSPQQQHTSCKGCPLNEYETAPNGKGKACGNGRRLLLAAIDESTRKPVLEELAILRLPPTSLKPFSSHVKTITLRKKKPLWAMMTNMSMDEDSDWPKVIPSYIGDIEDEDTIKAIYDNQPMYYSLLSQPYNVTGYVPPDPVEQAATVSRKSKMS